MAQRSAIQNAGSRIRAARSRRAAFVPAGHHTLCDRAEHVFQHVRREGFREVAVESRFSCFPTILFLPPSRDRGDIDVAEFRQIPQGSRDRIAIHHWKPDVEENHVRRELPRESDGRGAIMGQPGDVPQTGHRHIEHLRGIQIVFDNEDAKVVPDRDRRLFVRDDFRVLRRPDWQTDFYLGALARPRASDIDPALVHLHQAPCERQSDAQAAGRPFESRLRLLEHIEHPREGVGGDSNTCIADAHHCLIGLLVRSKPDMPPARRELHRIVEDIRKDLHEARAIAINMDRRRRQAHVQCLLRRRGERHDGFDSSLHQVCELVRLTTQLDLVGSDPRDIQEVVNESHELLHLTLNDVTGVCRSRRRCAELQTLKCEPNRCERISEFVRERCQKFVLTLIGFHEFGRTVTNPLFQLAVQCFSLVLGSLETLDEILIVEAQLERGFNHAMESPRRRKRRSGEDGGQGSHHQVGLIPFARQT